jgi:hypothetical protein
LQRSAHTLAHNRGKSNPTGQLVKLHNRAGRSAGAAGSIARQYSTGTPTGCIQRKGDDILLPGRLIKTTTLPDGTTVQTVRDGAVGRFTRNGDGTKVLKLRWNSKWWEVPTMEQVEAWTLDSVCETPNGDMIEPDADGSWLRLLKLV